MRIEQVLLDWRMSLNMLFEYYDGYDGVEIMMMMLIRPNHPIDRVDERWSRSMSCFWNPWATCWIRLRLNNLRKFENSFWLNQLLVKVCFCLSNLGNFHCRTSPISMMLEVTSALKMIPEGSLLHSSWPRRAGAREVQGWEKYSLLKIGTSSDVIANVPPVHLATFVESGGYKNSTTP